MSNLEKLITQKTFENENQRGLISLIFIGNWITSRHQQFFKRYGITMQQFNILRILRGQHPQAASINILKERMLDKMSDVSRLVERLRKADLVERKNSEMDRRAVDVRINDKGLQLLKLIDNEIRQLDNTLQSLNEKEVIQLNKLLDKMLDSYH
ncbi:DNA-binding transcriptional regulator, MarR family [Chitinophaga ginsengisegetis]|uniref:DNA-binding transcriptional regulator, MarR family n=1 Tax=Chitinophaga ginsengisegetis TaxID=393003 RepID=A0A1T5P1P8_9BACT|nr:MarR family transcriptional regulator [Chitinophaga ginsengisegetis]MDR6566801.1 DNA-binding MarR family transcriptional regulator [Chitinophaga ginsengisegetis]MDR6646531.1 DNA-binding MarR family transcriptional regulator [Chitinophaga ginsengisegetis]MDR6652881.1 DNA-binding MarR family transcriptional regulator [Chitinophaga ginsengisegetis]SKD06536.1 DNA-binding transcriptional regulator, MarR family [Chitinophaga ginsengisegetis]